MVVINKFSSQCRDSPQMCLTIGFMRSWCSQIFRIYVIENSLATLSIDVTRLLLLLELPPPLQILKQIKHCMFSFRNYVSGHFSIINLYYLGLIISGGDHSYKSVEVFVPSTGQHCTLPDLPAKRYGHTMEEMMVCGGGAIDSGTRRSCLKLTDNGLETTTTLLEER